MPSATSGQGSNVLDFPLFRSRFDSKVIEYAITWEAAGFYAPDGRVYPFGTDTKVLSTVFEALVAPIVREIANEYHYVMEGSGQTVYPDFTLTPHTGTSPRIAIDVKTTYRRFNPKGELQSFRYTLGSYTSFLRSPGAAKNIAYPYEEYGAHWTIGFLYTRVRGVPAKVYYRPDELRELVCPYRDVEYFVQEKYKIVGLTPASGNTTNIGSFPTSRLEDLRDGRGPFADRGQEFCDEYWRNFASRKAARLYTDIEEFEKFLASRADPEPG